MIKKINIKEYKLIRNQAINFEVNFKNLKDEEKMNTLYEFENKYYKKNIIFIGKNSSGKTSILEAMNLAFYFNNVTRIKLFLESLLKNWFQNKVHENDLLFHFFETKNKKENTSEKMINRIKKFNLNLNFKLKSVIKLEWESIYNAKFDFNFSNKNIVFKFKNDNNSFEINVLDLISFAKNKIISEKISINFLSSFKRKIMKEILFEYFEKNKINFSIIEKNEIFLIDEFNPLNIFLKKQKIFNLNYSSSINSKNLLLHDLSQKEIKILINLIKKIDYNVKNVIFENEVFEIYLKNIEYSISFKNLSSGTKKTIYWVSKLFKLFKKGGYLFIDEIENGLHFSLIKFIINLFNNKDINKSNASIIFSTHFPYILENINFINDSKMIFNSKNKKFFTLNENEDIKLRTENKNNIFKVKNYYNDILISSKGLTPFSTISNLESANLMEEIEKIWLEENG